MRNKTKGKKTEEIAQPHIAESAQLTADEQSKKRRETPTSHHVGKTAKPRVERYGTGTPEAS
jgi:hypothetical protein